MPILNWLIAERLLKQIGEPPSWICENDVARHMLYQSPYGRRTKMVSLAAVPMHAFGHSLGILIATRAEIGAFREADHPVLSAIATAIAEDLQRGPIYQSALRDEVTGLYHRQAALDLLAHETARARRYQASLSVTLLDIDGFNYLKHNSADSKMRRILHKIGRRIASEVRQTDFSARMLENTFLLAHPMTPAEHALEIATRLRASFAKEAVLIDDVPLRVELSLGIASLGKDDDLTTLLSRVDRALAAAKRLGGNRVVVDLNRSDS